MMGDWLITFEFNQLPVKQKTPFEEQWNFEEIRNGFWLDAQHRIVHEPRGVYWVPPSRILVIERLQ